MRVLIVEDMKPKAELLKIWVEQRLTFDVKIAESIENAKNVLKYEKIDLILLDMTLPKSDKTKNELVNYGGLSVINYLRVNKCKIPVVVITQYTDFVALRLYTILDNNLLVYINEDYGKDLKQNRMYKGENQIRYLEKLHDYMKLLYAYYIGAVLFSSVNLAWKRNLEYLLKTVGI